jgi:outer membrane autotransporter protein
VAIALNHLASNPASTRLKNFLDTLPMQRIPGAYDLIAPAEYGAIFEIARSAAKMEAATIENRLDEVHASSVPMGPAGPAGPSDDKGSKEVMPPPENRLGVFANGSGEFVTVGDSTNAAGFNFASGAATVGVDYRFTEHFVAGVLLNYTGTTADLVDNGRINADAFRGGVYASLFGGGAYVNAYLGGAYSDYDVTRPGLGSFVRGNTNSGDFNALIATGYDVHAGNFTYGPVASFQYTYTGVDSFNETGSLDPLHINSSSGESILTNVGARATYDWHIGSMVLVPEVRATWQHEYSDTFDEISATMLLGSPAFSVTSSPIGRDSLVLNAGFTLRITPDWSAYAFYDGELARANYQANNLLVGFRASF